MPKLSITTEALLQAAQRAAEVFPAARLVRNEVGDLSVLVDGEYAGHIDLTFGEVYQYGTGQPHVPVPAPGPQPMAGGNPLGVPDSGFIWLGMLSGFVVQDEDSGMPLELAHRCGFTVNAGPEPYLGNLMVEVYRHIAEGCQ